MLTRLARAAERALLRRAPEYGLFRSEHERTRALDELDAELHAGPGWGRAEGAVIAAAVLLLGGLGAAVAALAPWTRRTWLWAVVAGLGVLGAGAVVRAWRRGVLRHLRRKLIEYGVPVCRRCGYPMTGLARGVCPECGWEADGAVAALMGLAGATAAQPGSSPSSEGSKAGYGVTS